MFASAGGCTTTPQKLKALLPVPDHVECRDVVRFELDVFETKHESAVVGHQLGPAAHLNETGSTDGGTITAL